MFLFFHELKALLLLLFHKRNAQVADHDEMALVEVSDSTFEHLLAHMKRVLYVFCFALVAEGSRAAVGVQIFEQRVGKRQRLLASCGLQRDVELAVGSDV